MALIHGFAASNCYSLQVKSNIQEVRARKGTVIAITDEVRFP